MQYKIIIRKIFFHIEILVISVSILPIPATAEEPTDAGDGFYFDSNSLLGDNQEFDIETINQSNILVEGQYLADIYLNTDYYERKNITFKQDANQKIRPCFQQKHLKKWGITISNPNIALNEEDNTCRFIDEYVAGATDNFDIKSLKLNILVPQIYIKKLPKDYIPKENLDVGETMLYTNYDINYFQYNANSNDSSSLFVNLDSGLNLGLWQIRQHSTYTYQKYNHVEHSQFNLNRLYAKRPLFNLRSELTLGEIYTPGPSLGSFAYRGLQLSSDNRMLASSEKGYAPTIRGVAKTTAVVKVFQNKHEIYQTTVAPGDFEIKELYSIGYSGDLDVYVIESDGTVSSFKVAFTAVPGSIRPGYQQYHLALGEASNFKGVNAKFLDASYNRGINNALTINSNLRIGEQYQALALGSAFSTKLGGIGLTTSVSNAMINNKRQVGTRWGISYSKTFLPSQTSLTLVNYKQSKQGFKEFVDVLGVRQAAANHSDHWDSYTYNQKSQSLLQINQSLKTWGSLYFSVSLNKYYGKKDDKQLQAGYSNNYKGMSYSLNYNQQKIGTMEDGPFNGSNQNDKIQKSLILSMSFPFGERRNSPTLEFSAMNNNATKSSYSTSLSGVAGENNSYNYSVNVDHDSQQRQTNIGAHIAKQASLATVSASISKGKNYKQFGGNMQGAMIIHGGGITLAPRLSETFALIEAKGAKGADVLNGAGSRVNRFGFAVVPSIVPYQYNQIGISSQRLADNHVELLESTSQVAPYSGSSLKVKFRTVKGYPILVTVPQTTTLQMGASVFDEQKQSVGTVGQGNQIYARVTKPQGILSIDNSTCQLPYHIEDSQNNQAIIKLQGQCQ